MHNNMQRIQKGSRSIFDIVPSKLNGHVGRARITFRLMGWVRVGDINLNGYSSLPSAGLLSFNRRVSGSTNFLRRKSIPCQRISSG